MFSRKSSPDLCFQGIYQLTYALKLYINWPMLSSCSADSFLFWIHSSGIDMVYLNKIFIRNVQGGQNFLKKSEQSSVHFQNKSVKSVHFFCKKSVQFFQFFKKIRTNRTLKKNVTIFEKNTHQNWIVHVWRG